MKKFYVVAQATFLAICTASNSFAIGASYIGDEVPSARAAGQGYVGVAGQNEDPTAVYSNPGAMTSLLGTQATFGLTWENIHGSYDDPSGSTTKERTTNVGVPNFSVTQSFFDGKLSAGLSSQSPFGLETYWPSNSPLRYAATDSRLDMVDITPLALAYKVCPMVSIGAGADYVNLFNATLNRALSNGPSTPDGSASLTGQGTSWGYHAGFVLQPNEKNSFGVTYHSKVDLRVLGSATLSNLSGILQNIFGGSNYSTSAYTDIVLPANIQLGYAFKPTDRWLFEVDAAWFDWASTQNLNVRYAETDPTRLFVLNTGNPTSLNPRDSWSFSTGTNYKLNEKWQLRGGFWYEPNALQESNFSPVFMDLSRYGLSAGFGYALTTSLGIDAAYSAVFMHNEVVTNNVGANGTGNPAYNVDGTYHDFANLLSLNVTYKFVGWLK